MIKIKNLSKTYEVNSVVALNNVNLTVDSKDIYGVIGLSGAGKSTLLRCLACLEKASSGEITIDNVSLSSLSKVDLRIFKRNIGVVFQGFSLLKQATVFDNVAFPLKLLKTDKKIISEKVNEILELVGLSDKSSQYPANLSGGQIQRVAIARALITNPKVLLLDEITSALDPLTTIQILNLLKEINEKYHVTILLITHDMSVVKRICNKVAILYEGCIIENGLTCEVINNPQSEVGKFFLKGEHYD